ncbi:unnamed protein product [Angiostrongylus costaricensis]|uniref:GRIP domain-containing protein n=1 Tax=Angiostrongylus costaricensis TaxID=334426 RepID=A0A158PGT7_ANGCS|nr:unnamed protein product [Angiostrongylus costaricensis]
MLRKLRLESVVERWTSSKCQVRAVTDIRYAKSIRHHEASDDSTLHRDGPHSVFMLGNLENDQPADPAARFSEGDVENLSLDDPACGIVWKDLKERNSEVDALKKKLQKAEKDRQQWEAQKRQLESKLPIDVQLLMAQKRELTMQLDREQNEKHELFLQMNSMVAQLADTQPPGEVEKLKSHNLELQRRVEELEADIEETKKELHMKAAALQSLMLATQDCAKADRLKEEKEALEKLLEESEAALAASRREVQTKNEEIKKLLRQSEDSSSSSQKLDVFKKKLDDTERALQFEIENKESLMKSCEKLLADGKQAEEKIKEWRLKHEEDETVIANLRNELQRLEKLAQDEAAHNRRWEFERSEEVRTLTEKLVKFEAELKEKESKIDSIRLQLLTAQSRAEQTEADLKAKEQQLVNAERRVQQLQAQLDVLGKDTVEVDILREELREAESRYDAVVLRHQESETTTLRAELEASHGELSDTKDTLQNLERELSDVKAEKKKLESKASVAEELSTLMTSLSAVRAENGQFQEEIRSLHAEVQELKEELERSVELCEEWKGRAEVAEREKEIMEKQISGEKEKFFAVSSTTKQHRSDQLRSENGSELETENNKLREDTRVLHEELLKVKSEQKANEEESMRKLQELTEKCDALQKEASSSRLKCEALEEEHNRFRDLTNREKNEWFESSEEQRGRVKRLLQEVEEYKEKLKAAEELATEETKKHKMACEMLAVVEKEYEEMKSTLRSIQGVSTHSLDRLQDSENLAAQIKQQFEELEKQNAAKLDEMATSHKAYKERLDKRIEDMEAARLEQVKELERQKNESAAIYQEKLELAEKRLADAEESHRIECERLEIALREKASAPGVEELQRVRDEAEAAAKEQNEKLNKKVADLENRLNQASKNNTEMIANMRDMSALLETEAKKREELTQERRKWMEQLDEMERQLEEARNSSEEESKLAAENVRLASEMLKAHSQAEKTLEVEKELMTKQFSDKLKVRKDELASIQAELDAVRKEKAKLKEEVESFRSNNNGHPVPAARRTISNMSTYTYNTQTDFSEIEDVQRLRSEIDK